MQRDKIPHHCEVLPSIWLTKRKRELVSKEPMKYKAWLNIHGGKQEFGVNFYKMFSPAITWTTLRLLFVLSSIHSWTVFQINYILAFPQDLICIWKSLKEYRYRNH